MIEDALELLRSVRAIFQSKSTRRLGDDRH